MRPTLSSQRPKACHALSRRSALAVLSATALVPRTGWSSTAKEITWDDLIPPGIPYAEITGEGILDEEADFWRPVYDENATKLNEALNGAFIKMPGFIIPMEIGVDGVTDFMLVPYVGACIHTPPPPANQLVVVHSPIPWPGDNLWDAVWVTGTMRTQLQDTDLGQTGYAMRADDMEIYVW